MRPEIGITPLVRDHCSEIFSQENSFSFCSTGKSRTPLAEEPIALLDQRTAQTQMAFGLLYALSFLLATWIA